MSFALIRVSLIAQQDLFAFNGREGKTSSAAFFDKGQNQSTATITKTSIIVKEHIPLAN